MKQQPDIIIVGASARAAAFSALRAGMRPYAIDLFADSDLADVCPAIKINRYPHDFEQALAKAPQAPWLYTGGLENYPDLVERLAALRPLFGNGGDVLRRVRSPELLAACLSQTGSNFSVPEIRTSRPPLGSDQEWLRKPRRSSAGLGIRKAKSNQLPKNEESFYYQQYVPGVATSAVFLANGSDCQLLGMTKQESGVADLPEEPFLYSGSQVSCGARDYEVELEDLGRRLTRQFGLWGLFNVDFVNDYSLLEVNPRYSASIEVLEHSQGKNFLAIHVLQFDPDFRVETECSISHRPACVAKRVVYALCDCVVAPELNRLRVMWNPLQLLPGLADIPRTGDRILRGQPVATVIAEGASDKEAQQVLKERVNDIRQSLSPA